MRRANPGPVPSRNERQWSAVSVEELAEIRDAMDLNEPLTAASVGANICLTGLPELFRNNQARVS